MRREPVLHVSIVRPVVSCPQLSRWPTSGASIVCGPGSFEARGKPTGPPFLGKARILADSEAPVAERALKSNYGLGRRIYSAFTGSVDAVYVEVTPTGGS